MTLDTIQTLPHIAEYGSETFRANRATVTVLRSETRRRDNGVDAPAEYRYDRPRTWTITHVTPGYVDAGSCARYQAAEIWKVTAMIDGSTFGKAFLSLAEAEADIAKKGELV